MKKSTPCCPLTSKSTLIFPYNCFGLFLLVTVLDLCIFLSQFRLDDFFTGERNLLLEVLYFDQKQQFEVKNLLILNLFLTNTQILTLQDINWWTGVVWITWGLLWCFYQLFGLSFWRHPFTAEDPLVSKWCNAKFLKICSDEQTNSSNSWRVNFQQIFIFG